MIEEATEVSEKDFDKLNLSVRDKDSHPKIILCLNPSHKKHWIYRRFFEEKKIDYDFNGIVNDTLYIHTTYFDNLKNLDQSFLKEATDTKEVNILKYNNLFLGQWNDENKNALWSNELLALAKDFQTCQDHFESKYYLGIDIAVSTNKDSDETALTLIEKNKDQFYVLECIHRKVYTRRMVNEM